MKLKCLTCGTSLAGQDNFVKFNCPACGETEIVRCARCKNQSVPYGCKCGFEGP
ncbi:MAG TPA: zinc finger domain-containing protein [archaeon]|nr:zinc finger domain-containing protein [archaeon]